MYRSLISIVLDKIKLKVLENEKNITRKSMTPVTSKHVNILVKAQIMT